MIYALLRAIAGLALRWYYKEIEIGGLRRIPRRGPVLLVVNHPNALVDALVIGWVMPRRIGITAKSTLFTNPLAGSLLSWIGVIPLRRARDEHVAEGAADPARNADAFKAVVSALAARKAVLIFPEGTTHDNPSLSPLRTGAARMALDARDGGVTGLAIVPIGLIFDRKEALRSRVFAHVGEPLAMDTWTARDDAVSELTAEISARLHAVTLNYESLDEAEQAATLATTIARLLVAQVPSVGSSGASLGDEALVARRIAELRSQLAAHDPALAAWGLRISGAVNAIRTKLYRDRIRFEDVGISTGVGAGMRFLIREAWIVAIAGPVALWGEINHFIPFRISRAIAMRSVESAADPAMRTIVSGAVFVLLGYVAQGILVEVLLGPLWALVYLVSLPISADINFRLQDRLRQVARRCRTYLLFRRKPGLQAELETEISRLRAEALAFDAATRERETRLPT